MKTLVLNMCAGTARLKKPTPKLRNREVNGVKRMMY